MQFKDVDRAEFALDWETMSVATMAQKYGAHGRTVQYWAKQIGLPSRAAGIRTDAAIAFPANAGEDYDQAIKVKADRAVIIGDCEIPDHSISGMENVIKVARKFDIKTLIINGDFVALDSFSKWAKSQINKVFFKQELGAALISLEVFLQTFDNIYYISGNHELRLPHMIDGQISVGSFLNQLAGVEFSEYAHCELKSGTRDWLVCHQKNFSIVPLSVPAKLAVARQKSVWAAHNHRLAWGYDPSGIHCLVEGGHLRDDKKTHYKQLRVTTHPMWNSGFGMCIDGMPYLVDKNNLDFWMSIQVGNIENELKKATPKKRQ